MADTAVVLAADLFGAALAANDRLKYYFTIMQAAQAHARAEGTAPFVDLRAARDACGITEEVFERSAAASSRAADGATLLPGAAAIRAALFEDLRRMLQPIAALASADPALQDRLEAYERRLTTLEATLPPWDDGRVTADALALATAPAGAERDTVHALVMDLHRELNALLPRVSPDIVDGARVAGITDDDRGLVAAFMKGLHSTAPLKFAHPGLETSAARYDGCLAIQNELGTTAGHLLVIRIKGLDATLVYGDARRARTRFFRLMLEPCGMQWESAPAEDGAIVMTTGHLTAADPAALQSLLGFIASRLVFLIDWNRARKQLTRVVRKRDAVAVLKWAADSAVGHRGFLQAGGMNLISTAAERVAPAPFGYGARLDDLLGPAAAISFLQSVLRIAATGLQEQRSPRLIQDEVEAELRSHLHTAEARALEAASNHAWLLSSLVERVREALDTPVAARPAGVVPRLARLAADWESRADDLVRNAGRAAVRGRPPLAALLQAADEAMDALEETSFLLTLLHEEPGERGLSGLAETARIVSDQVREYVRALERAREVERVRSRAAVEDVLLAADRIAAFEHAADAAERAARAAIVEGSVDFRELQILSDAAHGLEHAADAVARCGRLLRDYALDAGAAI